MDALDLAILRTIQKTFPLAPRPYRVLAGSLGASEGEVFRRVSALRRSGVIRRLGPLFSWRRLGLVAHLVAARVEDAAVDRLAEVLLRRDEVTHNYLRRGTFNVWFTAVVRSTGDLDALLDEVRACPGVSEVRTFTTRKVFKLDASFALEDNGDG